MSRIIFVGSLIFLCLGVLVMLLATSIGSNNPEGAFFFGVLTILIGVVGLVPSSRFIILKMDVDRRLAFYRISAFLCVALVVAGVVAMKSFVGPIMFSLGLFSFIFPAMMLMDKEAKNASLSTKTASMLVVIVISILVLVSVIGLLFGFPW